jgi:hypothetical protein
VLTNTTIANNIVLGSAWYLYGGGIYIDSLSRMTAIRSSVVRNGFPQSSGNWSSGGGITVGGPVGFGPPSGGALNLYECVVSGNMGGTATFGGGIYNTGLLAMRNCLVYSNKCLAANADALYLAGGAATMVNCTFAYNNAVGVLYGGGAVAMTNCIVWGHTTADLNNFGGQLANVGYSAFALPATQHGVNGCLTNDPLFVSAVSNDFRLQFKPVLSPASNRGTNGLGGWMLGYTDLDGQRRIQAGTIDMGAYEVIPPRGTLIVLR